MIPVNKSVNPFFEMPRLALLPRKTDSGFFGYITFLHQGCPEIHALANAKGAIGERGQISGSVKWDFFGVHPPRYSF